MLLLRSYLRSVVIVALSFVVLAPLTLRAQTATVVVATVVERELNTGHRVVGTVMPIRTSTVGTAVDGRVIEFLIDQGDAVTAGQPLAKLRTGTLEIELQAAQAELRLRKEELAELVNGSRPEEVAEARARMLAARAQHRNSLTRLKRLEQLFERNAVNQTEVDDAVEQSEAASQSLLALEAALSRIEAGPRAEQIAQAEARVALQQVGVELIEDRILKFTIFAPFDGYIAARYTEVGEWVSQADPIADVVALDQVEILCNVPAEQAVRLQRDRTVRIEFPELPDETFTGSVDRVVPVADNRTRTFPVRVRLTNRIIDDRPVLLAGMLARAVLPTGSRAVMPLVPKDALVLNGSRRYVFVVETATGAPASFTVRSVPVVLGVADDNLVQVEGALKAGDRVVVRGNERLKDGQQVSISVAESSDVMAAD